MHKLAIDFGTTNSVIARWDETTNTPEVVTLPGMGAAGSNEFPPVVPSLLYVDDGAQGVVTLGQHVRDKGLDVRKDNRLFRNFKRGIVSSPTPEPRMIDGKAWGDHDAGQTFIHRVLEALPYPQSELEQLVLTAPVASFEGYLAWLNRLFDESMQEKIRIVDESTAAALGYAVTKPGAVVLVFDFGGGTLDISLVELPESRAKTGGILGFLRRSSANQHTARVIAKAGRIIGGSDVDQWMVSDVLAKTGVSVKALGKDYPLLLTRCEGVKIALSAVERVTLSFEAGGAAYNLPYTRQDLETLLEANGFYTALRRVVDKVMHVARQRGIFKEDIHYVLLVGGTSLMPSVQATLKTYFTETAVRADKPFTAVAEGALQVAAGYGLEDYLVHSYGIRHLDTATGAHHYDEIIPMGSRYPTQSPIEVMIGAAHAGQREVEFVIGEINTDSVAMIEVKYEDGQAVFVAQANTQGQQIIPLNPDSATLAALIPPGDPGADRLKADFSIDARRQLRLTVTDLHTQKTLLNDVVVVTLH